MSEIRKVKGEGRFRDAVRGEQTFVVLISRATASVNLKSNYSRVECKQREDSPAAERRNGKEGQRGGQASLHYAPLSIVPREGTRSYLDQVKLPPISPLPPFSLANLHIFRQGWKTAE